MKLRIWDRILVFLAGIILAGAAVCLVMETFFGYTFASSLHAMAADGTLQQKVLLFDLAFILFLLGVYCVFMLFRRKKSYEQFVVQKGDGGEVSISIKALENLVKKVLDQHDEINVSSIALSNARDGLIIRLRVAMATGINIPVTVSALQKQIKQYVTSCSGVDVKEVKVQVETGSGRTRDARKADKAMKNAAKAAAPETIEPPKAMAAEPVMPEQVLPVAEIAIPAAEEAAAEAKKRPFHQRIFGRNEEPAVVPAPPAAPAPEADVPAEEPAEPAPIAEIQLPEEAPTPTEEKIETAEAPVAEAPVVEAAAEETAPMTQEEFNAKLADSPVIAPWAMNANAQEDR